MNLDEKVPGKREVNANRIELARTFADLGDAEMAMDLLTEVMDEGNKAQRSEAEALYTELH
ncbi:MAG: FimV/HubP family polar landmark protein [Pseudomonadota bacterium]